MRAELVIVLYFLIASTQGYYIKQSEGLLTLSDDNFDYVIRDYDYVLVEFTYPQCYKCMEIDEDYRRAAQELSQLKPPIYLAQIDAKINRKAADRLKVKGHPTFVFFNRGIQTPYYGGKDTFADFHNWVYKKVFPSAKLISTEKELKQSIEVHDIVVLYFGNTTCKEFSKVYELVARRYDKAFFLRADQNSTELQSLFNITQYPHAILFRHFEENQVQFQKEWTPKDLERWIVQSSAPTVFEYNQTYNHHVFIHKHLTLFLFRDSKSTKHQHLEQRFYQIAQEVKDGPNFEELMFATSDIRIPEQKKVADFLGITREDFPLLAIVHPHDKGIEKYIFTEQDLDEHMTYDKLLQFLHDQKTGKIPRFLKVQDNKEEIFQNGATYTIKGNFKLKKFIQQSDKDVVVLFYASINIHSQRLQPVFQEVAGIFSNMRKSLVFGTVDVIKNDIEYKIKNYPEIYLFKKGEKDKFIEYRGDRTRKSIVEFLNRHSIGFQSFVEENDMDLKEYDL